MILRFLRKSPHEAVVERLHGEIVAAARQPALFLDGYGVADTLEGRFDLLVLHAFLVLSALGAKPAPGQRIAQETADRLFSGLDAALREMGVGDLAVPKRMKKMGDAYNGRSAAYAAALAEGGAALETALARNIYGSTDARAAARLARYVRATAAAMAAADLAAFQRGPAPFVEAAEIA